MHAKTKNGETPLEICEDPELKERIIQLKSEMETKRGSHTNKLKRSHSSNTRSQSVRRTSIREKTQISRREAREEARLRTENQASHQNGNQEDDDESKVQLDIKQYEKDSPHDSPLPPAQPETPSKPTAAAKKTASTLKLPNQGEPPLDLGAIEMLMLDPKDSSSSSDALNESEVVSFLPTGLPKSQLSSGAHPDQKEAVVIRNTGFCERDGGGGISNSNLASPSSQADLVSMGNATANMPRGSSGESVKVEIHVTVNTNPNYGTGTLADLKKQRADMRHRGSGRVSPSESPTNVNMHHHESGTPVQNNNSSSSSSTHHHHNQQQQQQQPQQLQQHLIRATYLLDSTSPPSPSTTLKKFRGDPSEVVGESHKQGCCSIS